MTYRFVISLNNLTVGQELFASDGSPENTILLKDAYPGPDSSKPEIVSSLPNGQVIFHAKSVYWNTSLWTTDGTPEGTSLIEDNGRLSAVLPDGRVLYSGKVEDAWYVLKVTDGTPGGNEILHDIEPLFDDSAILANGNIIFDTENDGTWVTDGTPEGTVQVTSYYGRFDSSVTLPNGLTLFHANNGLWATDGTPEGTTHILANSQYPGPEIIEVSPSGLVLLRTGDGYTTNEYWVTDGTTAGTIALDLSAQFPYQAESLPNGKIIFEAHTETYGNELWVTDGTATGTQLLKDISPGDSSPDPDHLLVSSLGFALFEANSSEIWITNGTPGGTKRLLDASSQEVTGSLYDDNVIVLPNGRIIFEAADPFSGSWSIWSTDGTPWGTGEIIPYWDFDDPVLMQDGKVLFTSGEGLWISDGTRYGTQQIGDFSAELAYSVILPNGNVLFSGYLYDEAGIYPYSYELLVTDGSEDGTQKIDFSPPDYSDLTVGLLGTIGGKTYLDIDGWLFETDGTAAGTTIVDIRPGGASSDPRDFIALPDGRFLFEARDEASGFELWVTDGTADGTMRLADMTPGLASTRPSPIAIASDGSAFIRAYVSDSYGDYGIWKTDGTPEGTVKIADYDSSWPATGYSDFFVLENGIVLLEEVGAERSLWTTLDGTELTLLLEGNADYPRSLPDGRVLFYVASGENEGIWVSDGTVEGTTRFVDLDVDLYSDILLADGRYVFEVDGSDQDDGLWVSDGTLEGTLFLGALSRFSFAEFMPDGRLLFTAYDESNVNGLWITDGTVSGTLFLENISTISHPIGAAILPNGGLMFNARNPSYETSLWFTDGTPEGTVLLEGPETDNPEVVHLPNGLFIFEAESAADGFGLWVSNGSVEGTTFLKDLNSELDEVAILADGHLLFKASSGAYYNTDLWVTDGTTGGTVRLKDSLSESVSDVFDPGSFLVTDTGLILLNVYDKYIDEDDEDFYTNGLWVTDGTVDGTVFLGVVGQDLDSYAELPNGNILFKGYDFTKGYGLWVTDGTPEGTKFLAEADPGNFIVSPNGFALFRIDDDVLGHGLWITDGTPDGTLPLPQFDWTSGYSGFGTHVILPDGSVLFVADDGSSGKELWKTDGTLEGTVLVEDINTGPGRVYPTSIMEIIGDFDAPTIEDDQSFSYMEGRSNGFEIGTVAASDDTGITEFRISGGNDSGYFAIDANGTITLTDAGAGATAAANNFETAPNSFLLTIEAEDDAGNIGVSTVTVSVTDEDEQDPSVAGNQSFTYVEGRAAGYAVGKVVASDNTGVTAFGIIAGNDRGYYAIDSFGIVTLTSAGATAGAASNDFETSPNEFTLTVEARDAAGNTGNNTIEVSVSDSDEKAPTVVSRQAFSYSEGQSTGYRIGTVKASDNVGIESFTIKNGNASRFFAIDRSGNLTLTSKGAAAAAANDFETGPNAFTLLIEARDAQGNTGTASVTVTVKDVGGISFVGTKGSDSRVGTGEADSLMGKNGKDSLDGAGGDDVINGGKHKDVLTGGSGFDEFVFSDKLKNKWADKLNDFDPDEDTIVLARAIFKKTGKPGELKAKYFDEGKKADSAKDRILYDQSGWLRYDRDGSKSKYDPIKFAKVGKGLDLSADDFLLI